MSALNVTQAEADVLVDSLKMFAKVHENASGVVPEEVAALLAKLAPEPEPVVEEVVVEEAVAEVSADVVEPTEEEVEAHFAETEATEETKDE